MGLRDRLRNVVNRLSGEYSAAQTEIRPDEGAKAPIVGGDVKVTRARLKRPKDADEELKKDE